MEGRRGRKKLKDEKDGEEIDELMKGFVTDFAPVCVEVCSLNTLYFDFSGFQYWVGWEDRVRMGRWNDGIYKSVEQS